MSIKDGGPSELTLADMINNQREAYAEAERVRVAELRDHFAGLAMQGSCACPDNNAPPSVVARWAYEMADAMLRAREAGQ